ncbi:MAG: hypothetical protein PHO61_04450 [Candidatus ainarchaeum sp.]|nr:hypothetical protein [Candidatus ainarchaeum sp.]
MRNNKSTSKKKVGRPNFLFDPVYKKIIAELCLSPDHCMNSKDLLTNVYGDKQGNKIFSGVEYKFNHRLRLLEKNEVIKVKKRLWRNRRVLEINISRLLDLFYNQILVKKYSYTKKQGEVYKFDKLIEKVVKKKFCESACWKSDTLYEVFTNLFVNQALQNTTPIKYSLEDGITIHHIGIKNTEKLIAQLFLRIYLRNLQLQEADVNETRK